MAVTRGTLQIMRGLRRDIGTEVDGAVRTLTSDWVREWDSLAPAWHAAAVELVAAAVALDRWPAPMEIMRDRLVDQAMRGTISALDKLAERTDTVASDGADRVVQLDAEREARLVASQAPDTEQPALARTLLGRTSTEALRGAWSAREDARADVRVTVQSRVRTDAVNVIAARAGRQIHADTLPLSSQAVDAMRRELISGIDVGANPRTAAARMVASVEGQFNGGLTRAMNIARTEMLDAYRATSQHIHAANADIVPMWTWLASFDYRVCPSCLSMHGSRFPVSEPGPIDHQQGRCTRLPALAPWSQLGISAPEPPSALPDAQEWFAKLPRARQLQIMGPGRLQLLDDGLIGWGDLSMLRQNPGWRQSRVPTPLRTLQQRADGGLPLGPAAATRTATQPTPPPASAFHRSTAGFEDIAARAATGTITNRRPLTGGMVGQTELVTFADGTRLVRKAGPGADAEQMASLIGLTLGVRTPRVYRTEHDVVWMDHVDNATTAAELQETMPDEWEARSRASRNHPEDADRIGLLDVLIGNVDRNLGNWMLTADGHTIAIDHGYAFMAVAEIQRLAAIAPDAVVNRLIINGPFAANFRHQNPLTPADIPVIRSRLEALRPDFQHIGRTDWLDYALAVLDVLARQTIGYTRLIR